jgi:PKHD-type hydroxylase
MLLRIPGVLNAQQLTHFHERLATASWIDGRVSAGYQGAQVKSNRQLSEDSAVALELGDMILAVLERHPLFISASLPAQVYPPMFNRYEGGQQFGDHVDNAVRLLPGSNRKIRTDISATLFLADPSTYDGGELVVEDTYGSHSVKLPAGDLILYPATSVHRVNPITRGVRVAAFLWVQSMVRDDAQRSLLFELDTAIQRLGADAPAHASALPLTGVYHNLLRMWSEPS